jgi:long-subunit acyl-CoA synthetase (AMP-forming)
MFIKFCFRVSFEGTSISHANVVAAMTGQRERVFSIVDVDNDVYVSYLPLGHILGLCSGL